LFITLVTAGFTKAKEIFAFDGDPTIEVGQKQPDDQTLETGPAEERAGPSVSVSALSAGQFYRGSLCRLCGTLIPKDDKYKRQAVTYMEEFKEQFSMNIEEDEDFFPTLVHDKCATKLKKKL
jgi:hypothetical protein